MEAADFPELTDFAKLANFTELTELKEKDRTLREKWNSWKKIELMEKNQTHGKGEFLSLGNPHKLSMTSMAWNISIGQLGPAAWLCSLPALVLLLIS